MMEFSAAAMVGGTSSRIAGGSFESGAVIGFFSRAFNDKAHGSLAKTYSAIKNWFNSPKTYQLGIENTQTIGGGYTAEYGFYFHQKGWDIDFGTYDSKGGAFGYDEGYDVGLSGYMCSPSDISGLSHVYGSSLYIGGYQMIKNDDNIWIGNRFFVGPGIGFSGTDEYTSFHSFFGRNW